MAECEMADSGQVMIRVLMLLELQFLLVLVRVCQYGDAYDHDNAWQCTYERAKQYLDLGADGLYIER